jgi:rhodanese-related sulfurtransferase
MDINVQELKKRIDAGDQNFVLIDVREPAEHSAFNIGGRLIPMGTIPTVLHELQDQQDEEIIVYCRSGGRSGQVQRFMQQQGFSNVRNLTGGMLAWQDAFGS